MSINFKPGQQHMDRVSAVRVFSKCHLHPITPTPPTHPFKQLQLLLWSGLGWGQGSLGWLWTLVVPPPSPFIFKVKVKLDKQRSLTGSKLKEVNINTSPDNEANTRSWTGADTILTKSANKGQHWVNIEVKVGSRRGKFILGHQSQCGSTVYLRF